MHVEVKEPPRKGDRRQARYHLKDAWGIVGWTDDRREAYDWLKGFGPSSTVTIEDRRSWVRK